ASTRTRSSRRACRPRAPCCAPATWPRTSAITWTARSKPSKRLARSTASSRDLDRPRLGRMSIIVKDIPLGGDMRDFLSVVDEIYAGDPNYVRPLDLELLGRLSRKNPFFEHAEGAAFVAYEDGLPVGRCSATVDHTYTERHGGDVGFFGFLDTVDKQEVTSALLERAATWLREHGAKRMMGPFSVSTNDEIGCLVDGFGTPPMVMMPHHRPYQGKLIEGAGLTKVKDLFAWRYVVGP